MRLVSMNSDWNWIRFGNVIRYRHMDRIRPVHVNYLLEGNRIWFWHWNRNSHWSIYRHVDWLFEWHWNGSVDVHYLLHELARVWSQEPRLEPGVELAEAPRLEPDVERAVAPVLQELELQLLK